MYCLQMKRAEYRCKATKKASLFGVCLPDRNAACKTVMEGSQGRTQALPAHLMYSKSGKEPEQLKISISNHVQADLPCQLISPCIFPSDLQAQKYNRPKAKATTFKLPCSLKLSLGTPWEP